MFFRKKRKIQLLECEISELNKMLNSQKIAYHKDLNKLADSEAQHIRIEKALSDKIENLTTENSALLVQNGILKEDNDSAAKAQVAGKYLINRINELKNENKKLTTDFYKMQSNYNRIKDSVDSFRDSVEVTAAIDENYYVFLKKNSSEEKYHLPADVIAQTLQTVELTSKYFSKNKVTKVMFFLKFVYWNNGGFVSFAESMPQLDFDKECIVSDDKGVIYTVTLTHDKVDIQKSDLAVLRAKRSRLKHEIDVYRKKAMEEINLMLSEKIINYPYLATIISDYREHLNEKYVYELLHKPRPAYSTAEKLKMVTKQLRSIEEKYRILKYRQSIYEDAFPWFSDLTEISTEDIEEMNQSTQAPESEFDFLKSYISHAEYTSLPSAERYQLALDRYKKKSKTNWQIGIAFERYIGYLYETRGYKVDYYGANKGFEDLGRDLIVKNKTETIIIQCKYWNSHKTIHEKHIFQLYGTMITYYSEHQNLKQTFFDGLPPQIKGLFITSCSLSDTARKYASMLNIDVEEGCKFDYDYPCIKCNISRRDGDKIYHLPFDQQYDNIKIEPQKGEFYCQTVAEAEAAGFRRAWRWHSQ